MATEKVYKFPKTMAACADRFYTLREERLSKQREADALEAEEKALKAHLIDSIPKSEALGVVGKVCRVTVTSKPTLQVKAASWPEFYAYVAKNKAWDMMGKTIKKEAIQDRLDQGKKLPFIETFNAISLSVNKV